jgi:hypothetical protein
MALSPSNRIGHYEVLSLLGTGGIGEVYRARDSALGRDVAIKVLPGSCTSDTERTARFQREAKVLASLNHPNIAAVYGLEAVAGARALVMELVEGPEGFLDGVLGGSAGSIYADSLWLSYGDLDHKRQFYHWRSSIGHCRRRCSHAANCRG